MGHYFLQQPEVVLAVVSRVVGPRSFLVKSLSLGKFYKRHLDHLVHTVCPILGD